MNHEPHLSKFLPITVSLYIFPFSTLSFFNYFLFPFLFVHTICHSCLYYFILVLLFLFLFFPSMDYSRRTLSSSSITTSTTPLSSTLPPNSTLRSTTGSTCKFSPPKFTSSEINDLIQKYKLDSCLWTGLSPNSQAQLAATTFLYFPNSDRFFCKGCGSQSKYHCDKNKPIASRCPIIRNRDLPLNPDWIKSILPSRKSSTFTSASGTRSSGSGSPAGAGAGVGARNHATTAAPPSSTSASLYPTLSKSTPTTPILKDKPHFESHYGDQLLHSQVASLSQQVQQLQSIIRILVQQQQQQQHHSQSQSQQQPPSHQPSLHPTSSPSPYPPPRQQQPLSATTTTTTPPPPDDTDDSSSQFQDSDHEDQDPSLHSQDSDQEIHHHHQPSPPLQGSLYHPTPDYIRSLKWPQLLQFINHPHWLPHFPRDGDNKFCRRIGSHPNYWPDLDAAKHAVILRLWPSSSSSSSSSTSN